MPPKKIPPAPPATARFANERRTDATQDVRPSQSKGKIKVLPTEAKKPVSTTKIKDKVEPQPLKKPKPSSSFKSEVPELTNTPRKITTRPSTSKLQDKVEPKSESKSTFNTRGAPKKVDTPRATPSSNVTKPGMPMKRASSAPNSIVKAQDKTKQLKKTSTLKSNGQEPTEASKPPSAPKAKEQDKAKELKRTSSTPKPNGQDTPRGIGKPPSTPKAKEQGKAKELNRLSSTPKPNGQDVPTVTRKQPSTPKAKEQGKAKELNRSSSTPKPNGQNTPRGIGKPPSTPKANRLSSTPKPNGQDVPTVTRKQPSTPKVKEEEKEQELKRTSSTPKSNGQGTPTEARKPSSTPNVKEKVAPKPAKAKMKTKLPKPKSNKNAGYKSKENEDSKDFAGRSRNVIGDLRERFKKHLTEARVTMKSSLKVTNNALFVKQGLRNEMTTLQADDRARRNSDEKAEALLLKLQTSKNEVGDLKKIIKEQKKEAKSVTAVLNKLSDTINEAERKMCSLWNEEDGNNVKTEEKIFHAKNKLHRITVHYDTINYENSKLREQISAMATKKKSTVRRYYELRKKCFESSLHQKGMTSQTDLNFDKRDEFLSDTEHLRKKNLRANYRFEEEMDDIIRVNHQNKVKNKLKTVKIRKRGLIETELARKKRILKVKMAHIDVVLNDYKNCFESIFKVGQSKDVKKIGVHYNDLIERNMILFRSNMSLKREVEHLKTGLKNFHAEDDRMHQVFEEQDKSNAEELGDYDDIIQSVFEAWHNKVQRGEVSEREHKELIGLVTKAFEVSDCPTAPITAILGNDEGVQPHNIVLYMTTLESHIASLIHEKETLKLQNKFENDDLSYSQLRKVDIMSTLNGGRFASRRICYGRRKRPKVHFTAAMHSEDDPKVKGLVQSLPKIPLSYQEIRDLLKPKLNRYAILPTKSVFLQGLHD